MIKRIAYVALIESPKLPTSTEYSNYRTVLASAYSGIEYLTAGSSTIWTPSAMVFGRTCCRYYFILSCVFLTVTKVAAPDSINSFQLDLLDKTLPFFFKSMGVHHAYLPFPFGNRTARERLLTVKSTSNKSITLQPSFKKLIFIAQGLMG